MRLILIWSICIYPDISEICRAKVIWIFSDLCRPVAATGYDGPISLEIFNDQFRRSDTLMVAKDGHRSLVNLVDQIAESIPESGQPALRLPPAISPQGTSYIECAIMPEKRDYYASFLAAIGFQHMGSHKSKQVDRFEQAGLNILLNYDKKIYRSRPAS